MNQYLEYLKNPLVAGGLSGSLIVLFAYLDKRMNDRYFDNKYYVKLFLCVSLLVSALVYFINSSNNNIKKGGNIVSFVEKLNQNGGSSSNGLEVYTDAPNF